MKNWTFLIAVFTSFITFSQSQNTQDFIILDSELIPTPEGDIIIKGHRALPWSESLDSANVMGVFLDSIQLSPCDHNADQGRENNKIIKTSELDSSIIVHTSIISNCCREIAGDLQIENDSTINLIFYAYNGDYCECDCCFQLDYYLTISTSSPFYQQSLIFNIEKRKFPFSEY